METQEFCHLGDINTNWQPKDKEMFRNKSENITNKEMPYLTRKHLVRTLVLTYPRASNITCSSIQ